MNEEEKAANEEKILNALLKELESKGYLPKAPELLEDTTTFLAGKVKATMEDAESLGRSLPFRFNVGVELEFDSVPFEGAFRLHFDYLPAERQLYFRDITLTAAGGEFTVAYTSRAPDDLPAASEMTRRLADAIMKEIEKPPDQSIDEKRERIEKYITSYQQLFEEKGYYNTIDGKPFLKPMQDAIRDTFMRCLTVGGDQKEPQALIVSFSATVMETGEQLVFSFSFKYDPGKVIIEMEEMNVKGEDFTITNRPQFNCSFPSTCEIERQIIKTWEIAATRANCKKRNPGRRPRL